VCPLPCHARFSLSATSQQQITFCALSAGGTIGEFVNPKYKDASKTAFKSSTRLECMMQDYPKALPPYARVGFTVINQVGEREVDKGC
jgi:hypothetical protein